MPYINNPDIDPIEAYHMRALIQVFNKRDNYLVNRIEELQQALNAMKASVGAADSIRDAIPPTFLPTATRARNDAIQDVNNDIDAGLAEI